MGPTRGEDAGHVRAPGCELGQGLIREYSSTVSFHYRKNE